MTGVDSAEFTGVVDAETAGVDGPKTTEVGADMHTEDSDDEEDLAAEMDQKYGPRWSHDHDLRPPKPRNYSHLHGNL